MTKFAETLKELRTEKGLSIDALAKKVSLSRSSISRWELGKNPPDIYAAEKLADFFQVSIEYMLGKEY